MPGGKSIYELVAQKIDLPQGLLYRGKYCGKSKLRDKMFEYGEGGKTSKRDTSPDELQTVQPVPVITDPQSARQAMDQVNKNALNMDEGRRNLKATKSGTVNTENKLKQMKKFYPEDYFRRSGYPFAAVGNQKKKKKNDLIYFKKQD